MIMRHCGISGYYVKPGLLVGYKVAMRVNCHKSVLLPSLHTNTQFPPVFVSWSHFVQAIGRTWCFIYSKTSLNRPILNGPFREVVGLGSYNNITMVLFGTLQNDRYRGVVDIGECSICGGGRLQRFYCSSRSHSMLVIHIHCVCVSCRHRDHCQSTPAHETAPLSHATLRHSC